MTARDREHDGLATALLAPIVLTIAAGAIHLGLPDRQGSEDSGTYTIVLEGVLCLAVVLAIVGWAWPRARAFARHRAPLLAGLVGWLGAWEFATLKRAWLPLPYFPGPDAVFRGLVDDRIILLESAYHSLRLLLTGYAIGVLAGIGCGVPIGWSRRVRSWGMPILKLVGPIPATAFVPLALLTFDDAFRAGAALIALAVWFPVTMLTASGIANVPASSIDVARTLGAGRAYLIARVAIPSALPSLFLGMFMGLGASFLTLIVAETVGVKAGLGWYLKWQQGYVQYARVYAALILMAAFFSGLMSVLFLVRDRVLNWQRGLLRW